MNLEYQLIRSDRRTIGITVERDRRVIVRAPHHAREEIVAAAIAKKRFWIWQKLRDPRKYPDPFPRKEYVTGESFLLFGQSYRLSFSNEESSEIKIVGGELVMGKPPGANPTDTFRNWYLDQANQTLRPRIASIAANMGLGFSKILIRDLKYRWGSCTPGGTLSFNWRIIQSPMIVVDYLIVHELAHRLVANHSSEFWNIVAIHAPAWERARDWLKLQGSQLEW